MLDKRWGIKYNGIILGENGFFGEIWQKSYTLTRNMEVIMDNKTTVGTDAIRSLFDAGTFVEIGAYVRSVATDALTGLVCGYGAIDGKLTFAFAQDMDRMKGALDEAGAKKLRAIYDMATKNGAPIVGLFNSAGAVVYDGSAALDAYGAWMRCVSDASGVVPQIALINGVCAGSAAVTASMFDLIVTVKDKTKLYMTTPFVLGEETATAEAAAKNGLSALTCESEAEAVGAVRALISLLPSNNCDATVAVGEDANRALTEGANLPAAMLDGGVMTELYAEFAPEMTTALGRMGGEVVGVVAAKGALTVDAARKAARMVSLCDAFRIPVVTLVDSEGVDVDAAAQAQPASAAYARLATAYAASTCAKVTVVTGKAYGAAYTLLGSRALGADLVLALPEAVISTMAPDKAVAFVWNDKVTETTTREMVEKEWIDTYAKPEQAAMRGDIDDVVPVGELRMRVCSALYMLATKTDANPVRRHPTLAL